MSISSLLKEAVSFCFFRLVGKGVQNLHKNFKGFIKNPFQASSPKHYKKCPQITFDSIPPFSSPSPTHKEAGGLNNHRVKNQPWVPQSLLCFETLRLYYCCSLVAKSCPTLCDLMDCSTPGFPVLHCLLEFAQIHVHWVSDAANRLILCR